MEQIKSELMRLRLSGMAACLKSLEETRRVHELSLPDGLKLLLQSEKDYRESNRYLRLVKNASFRYQASMEELSFQASRGLEQSHVLSLAWINRIIVYQNRRAKTLHNSCKRSAIPSDSIPKRSKNRKKRSKQLRILFDTGAWCTTSIKRCIKPPDTGSYCTTLLLFLFFVFHLVIF